MPKRTNTLQILVRALQEIAIPDAIVTESHMLTDALTGIETEVDVTIRKAIGDFEILVAIEVNAEGRKATIEWVREMVSKHAHLPTNRLVLINRSGFSNKARLLCERNDIVMLSLATASKDWALRLLGEDGMLWLKLVTLWPLSVKCAISKSNGAKEVIFVTPDIYLFDNDGRRQPLGEAVVALLQAEEVGEQAVLKVTSEHTRFQIEVGAPAGVYIRYEASDPPELHFVERLIIDGGLALRESSFEVEAARIGKQELVWGECNLDGTRKLFLAAEGLDGSVKHDLKDVPKDVPTYKRLTKQTGKRRKRKRVRND